MKNRSGRSGRKLNPLVGKTLRRAGLHRVLRGESLEGRHMMAGDVYLPYHNDLIPEDTNGDYSVSALDALLVINALNAGQTGELIGPGIGKADGPLIDVSGDNSLSALDALKIVNRLNGEGETSPLVGFTYQFLDQNGNPLPTNNAGKPQASVGQLVQLKTFIQDLRGFDAQGIFAGFLDLDYSGGDKFQVNVGEVQSFRYFYDKILTSDPTSSFVFHFGNETTAPVSLFNGTTPRSAAQVGAAIQSALEALPSIGPGNVIVRRDVVGSNQDQAADIKRNSYDIQFVNNKAGQDVPLLTLDASNIKVQTGQTFVYTLQDKLPADPNNPESVAAAFQFSEEFGNTRNVVLGNNQFDEVGAVGGLSAPQNPADPHAFFTVTLKAVAPGTVTFTPNPAESFPAHETLVFPKDVVPTNLISYGNPFDLVIASSILANDDAFTVAEDANATEFNVTNNDTLVTGSSFTITSVTASAGGVTPTVSADKKKISYKPAANFFGTDTFTYTITNNLGNTSTATVTITVTPVNDPITVPNQTASTRINTPVTLTTAQLTNGGDVGPGESAIQQLSIASVVSPSTKGAAVTLNNGSVTYTPTSSIVGSDSFTIVVTDNGQTNGASAPSTKTVTVNVTLANDAPVAQNDLIDTVDEDSTNNTLNVLANDNPGPNDTNDSLTIVSTGGTPTGALTIAGDGKSLIYTPAAGAVGTDTFTYTVRDLAGLTATATVTVELQPTNLPRARTDIKDTTEDVVGGVLIDVLGNDRTNENSSAILVSVGSAANGTVSIDDNQTPADASDDKILYTPNPNFSGTDTFTYVMNELPSNGGVPSTGTVTVNVAAVNDEPILVDDTAAATEDTVTTIASTTLLSNDSPGTGEANQQNLVISAVQPVSATGGSVALNGGNVVFTPAPDFNGQFVFTYVATDNGSPAISRTATVTLNVAAVNDAPIAVGDSDSTQEDTAKTIQATALTSNDRPGPATATDEVGQGLTITAVSPNSAQGGTVTLAAGGGSVTYTPAPNFFGTDTFTYTISDDGSPAGQATATATITVTPVNDAPTAGNDTVTAFKGVPLTIAGTTLLVNDNPGPANESGQQLTVTSVSGAVNGTVALASNGQIVFTPNAGYTGPASFSYTVSDNGQTGSTADPKTATGTVNITVQEFIPSSISGFVYVDETLDGILNAAERRLGGVIVSLAGTAFGQTITETVTTLADGSYHFDQLAPGSYTVSFVNPALLIDGKETAGALGDADGIKNNNSFKVDITTPGGIDATNYNFAVNGIISGYASVLEKLASRYYTAGSPMANYGLYSLVDSSGGQDWFTKLDGFDDVVFAETTMTNSGSEVILTIVQSNHDVYSALLGKGKFITMHDEQGNTVIRVLGGRDQLQFTKVNMAAPAIANATNYLDSVDEFFAQEGW